MVVAFVGFVGAWSKEILSADVALLGGAGASVATFLLFYPRFCLFF